MRIDRYGEQIGHGGAGRCSRRRDGLRERGESHLMYWSRPTIAVDLGGNFVRDAVKLLATNVIPRRAYFFLFDEEIVCSFRGNRSSF